MIIWNHSRRRTKHMMCDAFYLSLSEGRYIVIARRKLVNIETEPNVEPPRDDQGTSTVSCTANEDTFSFKLITRHWYGDKTYSLVCNSKWVCDSSKPVLKVMEQVSYDLNLNVYIISWTDCHRCLSLCRCRQINPFPLSCLAQALWHYVSVESGVCGCRLCNQT